MKVFFKNFILLIITFSLTSILNTVYAESVDATGEYLYGPETSDADACRLAEIRAKSNALSKVFGESISMEEQMSCREVRDARSDLGCELNRVSWTSIEGDIRSVTNLHKVTESRLGEKACIVSLTADIVIPDRKPDSNFDVKVSINERIYRAGEVMNIVLEPTVGMYIAIFSWVPYQDVDTIVRMYPNRMDKHSHISKKINIPTDKKLSDYNFTMTWSKSLPLNKTFVDEYLIVVGTKKPLKWLSSYQLDDFKVKLREIPLDERRVVKQGYQLVRSSDKVGSIQ